MWELLITAEDGRQMVYRSQTPAITIGRDSDNDLVLHGSAISRRHARVEWQNGLCRVTDLASTNGSQLNGDRLPPHKPFVWWPQVPLQLGNYQLQRQATAEDAPEPTIFLAAESSALRPAPLPVVAAESAPQPEPQPELQLTPQPEPAQPAVAASAAYLEMTLRPGTLRNRGNIWIGVTNCSRMPLTAHVIVSPPEHVWACWQEWPVELEPGGSRTQQLILSARRRRPWLGRARKLSIPINAVVKSNEPSQTVQTAELWLTPRLYGYRLLLALGVVLGAGVGLTLALIGGIL